jgi:DNA mismatch repair ATPase MutS
MLKEEPTKFHSSIESKELSKNTNILDYLMSTDEKAVVEIMSDNKELGNFKKDFFSERSSGPEPLLDIREGEFIWEFIKNPSTNLQQIKERQNLLKTIKQSKTIDTFLGLKNNSYLINSGISKLFEQVVISDYSEMPLLEAYRQGHEKFREEVMDCLNRIETGRNNLIGLRNSFQKLNKPIATLVEENIEQDLKKIEHLGRKYFLEEDFNSSETIRLNEGLKTHLTYLGSVIEMANIVDKNEMSFSEHDDKKPFESKNEWNFIRDKKDQVLNNSPDNKPLTIFNGTNMGGKSFKLETSFINQLLSQSYGCVATEKGNFDIYDSFFYLDRASTEASHNLSAFGSEVKKWINLFEKLGKKGYMVVDEGFSTTSAEDQYYLMMGVFEYIRENNGKIILATHNEEFIKNHINNPDVGIYNFPFTVEIQKEKMEINYSYKMIEGVGDPRALEVAEAMGLPKTLIELAKNYLNGVVEKVFPIQNDEWKKPETYTENKRNKLKLLVGKREELDEFDSDFIFYSDRKTLKTENKLFQLLSHDSEFKNSIYTGEEIYRFDLKLGGWGYATGNIRNEILLKLLTDGEKLSPKEIMERQKMFFELSHNDKFEEFKEMTNKLLMIGEFLPKVNVAIDTLLDLNLNFELNDSDRYGIEYVVNIFRLNKKILGSEFPKEYIEILDKFEKGLELEKAIKDFLENQDIFEIKGDSFSPKKIKKSFLKIANGIESEEMKEKWQGKICLKRIFDLIDFLEKNYERGENIDLIVGLARLISEISENQRGNLEIKSQKIKDLFPENYGRISLNSIQEHLNNLRYSLNTKEKLPRKTFFDCDLTLIAPEIKYFANKYKEIYKDSDLAHYNNWPPKLISFLIMEMIIDKDYFEEFPKLLKSYDSIELHQLANSFEKNNPMEYSPRKLFQTLEQTYKIYFKEMFDDYKELENSSDEVFNNYGIKNDSEQLDYIIGILSYTDNLPRWEITQIINDYEYFTGIDIPNLSDLETERLKEIYQKEIIDSGLKEKLEKFRRDLAKISYEKAVAFAKKYGLDLSKIDEYQTEKIKNGSFEYLRSKINGLFKEKVSSTTRVYSDRYHYSKEGTNTQLFKASALALFGHMINIQNYQPVEFNSTGEVYFEKMFNIFNKKEKQVLNDIHFDNHELTQIIAAANMAGKTYRMKSLSMATLAALNTGYAPASVAKIPFFDNVIYLDRVTEKFDKNLSALGSEVELWKQLFSKIENNNQKVFVISSIDEAFSTTSPKYQASLVYAVVMQLIKQGQYTLLATHNHDVVNNLRNIEKDFLKAYTIDTTIENGLIKFDHTVRKMKADERSFSEAILVAKTLGMPEKVIKFTETIQAKTLGIYGARQNLESL